jgi:integrase
MSEKRWTETPGMYVRTPTRGKFKGAPVYCGRVWVKSLGTFKHFTLGTEKKAATKRLHQVQLDPEAALQQRAQGAVRSLTVGAVLEEFIKGYRTRGGNDCRRILRAILKHFEDVPAATLTTAAVDRYLEARRALRRKSDKGRKVGESTLRKEIIAFNLALTWAKRRALVPQNPLAEYETPQEPGGREARALTLDEEKATLDLLPPLERDVVEWAIYTGMRRGEILGLTWPRIDRARGTVHVVGTKTGKARVVPLSLSGKLAAILERRPRRTTTALLFHDSEGRALDVDRLNGTIEAALKTAEVPKVRGVMWNAFRKTTSSRLYASGKVMPQDEAAWLGHSMAVAWKHYVEYSPAAHARAEGAMDQPAATVPPTVPPKPGREIESAKSLQVNVGR